MRICVAQTRPVKGDVLGNMDQHKQLTELAVAGKAEIIIFPELSLTGYEPELAKVLATSLDDPRLDDFQNISDTGQITIGVGIPTKNSRGICISMIIFQPHKPRQMYSKKYLHADEEPFFISGQNSEGLQINGTHIALAICYEISVPEHAENAFKNGADVYIASVAKFVSGIDKALDRMSEIAARYSSTVLMSNCVGEADGQTCAGKTSVWNRTGRLTGQSNHKDTGILIIDTDTQEVVIKTLPDKKS